MANQPAQKRGRSIQTYETPDVFLDAVKRRFNITAFAHDFAASAENTKAATYFDEARDALSVPHWEQYIGCDEFGWLNPPFANIRPWAQRCMETGAAGGHIMLLVPAGVGSNWFRDYVDGHALVLLLNGRLPFIPGGPAYDKDCILCIYGPDVTPGTEVWSWRPITVKGKQNGVRGTDRSPRVHAQHVHRTVCEDGPAAQPTESVHDQARMVRPPLSRDASGDALVSGV